MTQIYNFLSFLITISLAVFLNTTLTLTSFAEAPQGNRVGPPNVVFNPNNVVEITESPSVSFGIVEYDTTSYYTYDYNSVSTAGAFSAYENSSANGNYSSYRTLFPITKHDDDLIYKFGSSFGYSNFFSRYSSNTMYTPFTSSCHTTEKYKDASNNWNSTLHEYQNICTVSAPYRPIDESFSRGESPIPRGLQPESMKAKNCSHSSSWNTPYQTNGYYSNYMGSSDDTEYSTAGIVVSGDPSLEYFIEVQLLAWEEDFSGRWQPITVRGNNVEGTNFVGSVVKGWFPGTEGFYPISPNVASKCYYYNVSTITVAKLARKIG